MAKIVLIAFSFFYLSTLSAQQRVEEIQKMNIRKIKSLDSSGWKKTGFFILNLNQSALSDWSSGGERFLIGINEIFNYALHHRKGHYSLDAYMEMELGAVEAASFKKIRKTTDRCDVTVEVEHTMGKKAHYGLLFNFNSQLFAGRNYSSPGQEKISSFLSPGKFLLSPGIDLKSIKSDSYFSFFISPVTFRWVTKRDSDFFNQSKFGVDSAQKINTEMGAYISTHYNLTVSKTVKYIGRLDLFSNYLRTPQNVDVLLTNLLSFSISKIFAGNVLLDVIYDHDIKKHTQIQEIFGLGVSLKL